MRHFLAGVHSAVVAAILVTLLGLARTALTDAVGQLWLPGAALCAFALFALLQLRVNATRLVLLGGIVGLVAGRDRRVSVGFRRRQKDRNRCPSACDSP